MSAPQPIDFGSTSFNQASGSSSLHRPVYFYNTTGNRIQVLQAFGLLNTGGSVNAHTATDYFTFKLQYLKGDTTLSDAFSFTETTASMGNGIATSRYKRVTAAPNVWLPGNAWTLSATATRVGAAGTTNYAVVPSLILMVRLARP